MSFDWKGKVIKEFSQDERILNFVTEGGKLVAQSAYNPDVKLIFSFGHGLFHVELNERGKAESYTNGNAPDILRRCIDEWLQVASSPILRFENGQGTVIERQRLTE